jgi:uncharacterized protein (DUF58 family)
MGRLAGIGALGVALGVAAGLFDAEVLWVPGLALAALAIVLGASLLLAARGASIRRRLDRVRVQEDEPLVVRVRARAGRGALVAGDLRAVGTEGVDAQLRADRRWAEGEHVMTFPRRGRHGLAPARLDLRDPLGLGLRSVVAAEHDEVLVLPRVEPIDIRGSGTGLGAGSGDGRGGMSGAAGELDGLRPYRRGASASRIHWPALARGAGLMERRLLPDADRLPLVLFDPSGPASEGAIDAAARAAASLIRAYARTGGAAVLLPGDRRPVVVDENLAAWDHVHARLALVGPGPAPRLQGHAQRHRLVVHVAAAPARRLGAVTGARLVVGPFEGPGALVLEVAGCRGHLVPAAAEAAAV